MLIKKSAEGEATLELNEQIYPKGKIEAAVKDFKKFCDISFKGGIVTIKSKNGEDNAENIAREFSNYLLEITITGASQCL